MKRVTEFLFTILEIFIFSSCFGQTCGSIQTLTSAQEIQVNSLVIQLDTA